MPLEQLEQMREQMTKATLARKRLLEVAAWLDYSSEIKGNDPYLTTHDLAVYIRESVSKLDFGLDQFESFVKEGE